MARLPALARLLAFAIVTVAFACTMRTSSLKIDGVRYFWLDDDQMISMRYARNLAHGDGLVWNAGERVEGYTNPGWTLVMAGLHLLPISDAKMAIPVEVVSWLLACWILVLAGQLTRRLLPGDDIAFAFVLLTLSACHDLLFWAVNGFDTTLMTAVFLFVVTRLLDEQASGRAHRVSTYGAMSLLPIIRSDGLYVWTGVAIVALALSSDRPRTATWLAVALAPMALHVGWRRSYYGQWLPNTFYVKVSGVGGRLLGGVGYLKGFLEHYAVLVPLAGAAAIARRHSSQTAWLLVPGLVGVGYVAYVGADMWAFTRFLAFFVPLLLALAAAGVAALCRDSAAGRATVLTAVAASVLFQAGINGPSQFMQQSSGNGLPLESVAAAVAILKNTSPDAIVAVVAAGDVPYFSRRRAIDLMGLSDPHVSHLGARPGEPVGHAKYDIAYSLSLRPDLLVPLWNVNAVDDASPAATRTAALRQDPAFIQEYQNQPLQVDSLGGACWLYVRAQSTAATPPAAWRPVDVSR